MAEAAGPSSWAHGQGAGCRQRISLKNRNIWRRWLSHADDETARDDTDYAAR